MENDAAAYQLRLRADQPRQQRFFRDPRFKTAALVAVWGAAGILAATGPGVVANPVQVMLNFLFLMAGVLLVLLTVTAQDGHQQGMADMAASRFEGRIRGLIDREARRP